MPRRTRRWPLFVAVAAVLAVFAGALVALYARGSGDNAADQGVGAVPASPSAPTSDVFSGPPSTPTTSAEQSTPPSTLSRAPSIAPVGPLQRYSAPGGLSVRGPAGWRRDRSAGIASIRDYVDPASPDRLSGGYFRIGISNLSPSGSFSAEATQAANFLRHTYGASIHRLAFTSFLGATAADIEYSYVPDGRTVERHGVERLCRRQGVTLIVQASDVAAQWQRTQSIFAQLASSATVA